MSASRLRKWDSYIAKILKRVGFAKGSWINAAKAIGGKVRGAAQWVTRHKQAPGTAIMKTGDNPSVTLVNLNSDAVGVGVVINEWFAFLVTHASSCNYEMVAENIHESICHLERLMHPRN